MVGVCRYDLKSASGYFPIKASSLVRVNKEVDSSSLVIIMSFFRLTTSVTSVHHLLPTPPVCSMDRWGLCTSSLPHSPLPRYQLCTDLVQVIRYVCTLNCNCPVLFCTLVLTCSLYIALHTRYPTNPALLISNRIDVGTDVITVSIGCLLFFLMYP